MYLMGVFAICFPSSVCLCRYVYFGSGGEVARDSETLFLKSVLSYTFFLFFLFKVFFQPSPLQDHYSMSRSAISPEQINGIINI